MSMKKMTLKTICLILGFSLLLSGLSACGKNEAGNENSIPSQSSTGPEDHQTPEKPEWEKKLDELYEAYYPDLRVRTDEWEQEMALCNEEEKRIMKYYFITTDMSTLCGIDFSLLHKYASHAAMLRETMPWTKELPEDTFLCYVASYRHHSERVTDCREFFYKELKSIVEGRSLNDAILLVNNWCGEQAGYCPSDQRLASPLGMYNGGEGRCGEETCFTVNALRSVGIPARGCAVDWTVVAGDHEFVQVLVDGEWHFMGACEPDPVLDSSWFNDRLGSLLMTSFPFYSDIGVGGDVSNVKGMYILNDIGDFTDTKDLAFTVLGEEGEIAPGAVINLVYLENGSWIRPGSSLVTGENGKALCKLGLGTAFAFVTYNKDMRFVMIPVDETETVVSFQDDSAFDCWESLKVQYSDAPAKKLNTYTEEERLAFFGKTEVDDTRAANHAGDFDEARAAAYPECEEILKKSGRNFHELMRFLERDSDPMRSVLVSGLYDKYSREVDSETLEDILKGAEAVRGSLSDDDFIEGLLYPVWDFSYFSPQRAAVLELFTEDELSAFRKDPASLYKWFSEKVSSDRVRAIREIGVMSSPSLYPALKMGYCPDDKRTQVFMELARAVGIPVAMDEEEEWNYLSSEGWTTADFISDPEGEDIKYGTVRFSSTCKDEFKFIQWMCVSPYKYGEGSYEELGYNYYFYMYYNGEEDMEDEDPELEIPVGEYAVLIYNDREEGAETVYSYRFRVEEGKTTVIKDIK